jgi:large subunit ribosomal protein L12
MEYVYAALILNESGAEINEQNVTSVLDAADVSVEESRVKALIAALEDVDIDEAVDEAAAVPAPAGGGEAPAPTDASDDEPEEEPDETEAASDEDETDDDDDEDAGEGLGELFG